MIFGQDPEGSSVLTASAEVPRMRWFVFFDQPLSKALQPVYNLLFRTAWLLALGVLLAVLAGMLLARKMVIPIQALQVGAQQLEASEFGHRIEVETKDEIADLADHFNRMADPAAGLVQPVGAKSGRAHARSCAVCQRAEGARGDRARGRVVSSTPSPFWPRSSRARCNSRRPTPGPSTAMTRRATRSSSRKRMRSTKSYQDAGSRQPDRGG